MRILLVALSSLFVFCGAYAIEVSGRWSGTLAVGSMELPLVFEIKKDVESLKATLDSPSQNAFGIPTSSVELKDSILTINIAQLKALYVGTVSKNNKISGTFSQGGGKFPLDLTPEIKAQKSKISTIGKNQEPQPPYPYLEEEVAFTNHNAKLKFSGTLTRPKEGNKFPAVVMITGSGAQNRDEQIFQHKPFKVIADYLTRNGIAVLRYDDRGTGKSEGIFAGGTTSDFATDAQAAFDYLASRSDIDPKKIGYLGHSEGGAIAFINGATDPRTAFIVTLAAPGIDGESLMNLQVKLISEAMGADISKTGAYFNRIAQRYRLIKNSSNRQTLRNTLKKDLLSETEGKKLSVDELKAMEGDLDILTSNWYVEFIKYDPTENLKKIKCPVFALNGDMDAQVDAETSLNAINKNISANGNKNVTIKHYPNHNHLFQQCESLTKGFNYSGIEETISPEVLSDISEWIILTNKSIK